MGKSMTAFAKESLEYRGAVFTLEIKSLNHRYREVQVHLPVHSMEMEQLFRELVEPRVQRGKISLSLRGNLGSSVNSYRINKTQVEHYLNIAREFKDDLHLDSEMGARELFNLPGVLFEVEEQDWIEDFKPHVRKALETLMDSFDLAREKEGDFLCQKLVSYADEIRSELEKIELQRGLIKEETDARLRKKIQQIETEDLDEARLYTEIAYLMERMDVEEEIVRLRSHLDSMSSLLLGKTCGKKLNFLCQEAHREINTIGSKSSRLEILEHVIEMKSSLERFREQVQNLE